MNHFLIGLWCAKLSVFYMTTGNDQLSGWIQKLQNTSQSRTSTKKRSWSLVVCCLFDLLQLFWIPEKPLYLRSMLSKSMRCTENCSDCSRHWSTEWAQFFSMTVCYMTNALKSNKLGYKVLPRLPYSPDLLPTDYHFAKHLDNFLQAKCFCNQQEAENAFQELLNPEDGFLYYRNKHISCW